MRLTVLGACGAWPEAGQACSGYLVEHDDFRLVVDLGVRLCRGCWSGSPRIALMLSSSATGTPTIAPTSARCCVPGRCAMIRRWPSARLAQCTAHLPDVCWPGPGVLCTRTHPDGLRGDPFPFHRSGRAGGADCISPASRRLRRPSDTEGTKYYRLLWDLGP
jgi:hypothetical protein